MANYQWNCAACGKSGHFKHKRDATDAQLTKARALAHRVTSPECEAMTRTAVEVAFKGLPAALSLRDRHILISARLKRSITAKAMRDMRGHHPAPPERSGEAWDQWVAKVSMKRSGLRKAFKQTRALRQGYAFT